MLKYWIVFILFFISIFVIGFWSGIMDLSTVKQVLFTFSITGTVIALFILLFVITEDY